MADCGENYIDCTKHNESVESLFKRLISVDDEGNLSLNICGCGGGGGAGITSVTYAELVALIGSSGLTAGGWYLLTDFATKHYFMKFQGGTPVTLNDINTGSTEPLLLLATSTSTINTRVFSPSYPQDIIHYDWSADNWLNDISFSSDQTNIITGWKGVIVYREDAILDNSAYYDFRNVKFRRWALNPDVWLIGTAYAEKALVLDGTKVYCSLRAANTGNTPSISPTYWVEVIDMTTHVHWSWNDDICFDITVDANDYSDFYTWDFNTYVTANHIGANKDNYNFWYTNLTILNNIVFFGECWNNWLDGGCHTCTIDKDFSSNKCGSSFSVNIVGELCRSNDFGIYCSGNVLSYAFSRNVIGYDLCRNLFGPSFNQNTIENTVCACLLGANCNYNHFANNLIGVIAKDALLYCDFQSGISNVNLTTATHVYLIYSKTISRRLDGTARLTYIDNSDVQQIVAATA